MRRKFYKVLLEYTNSSGQKEYYTPYKRSLVQFNKEYRTPIEDFFSADYRPRYAKLEIGEGVFHLCTTKEYAKEMALTLGDRNYVVVRAIVPKNTVIFRDCTCGEVGVTKVIYTTVIWHRPDFSGTKA